MSLERFLATCWNVPNDHVDPFGKKTQVGLNVMLWGPPGSAKSDMVETVAAALQLYCHVIPCSTVPPEDVGGVFVQDGKGGVRKASWEEEIRMILELGEGVVFFDELSTAKQTNQSAFLTTFMKRKYGGEKLGPQVRLIGAGNPVDTSTGTFELSAAMANRLVHRDVDKIAEEQWLEYMAGRYKPDLDNLEDSRNRVEEQWPTAWPSAYGCVAGFVRSKRGNLHAEPIVGSPDRSKAWPSLRTWKWATLGIATARAMQSGDEVETEIVNGLVGHAVGVEFRKYLQSADLPTAEEMLANGWAPDSKRVDRCVAAYETLTIHVAGIKNAKDRVRKAAKAWEILLEGCNNKCADFIHGPAANLVNAQLGPSCGDAEVIKYCDPVMSRFYKYKDLADGAKRARSGK